MWVAVKLYVSSRDGSVVELARHYPPAVFGELALLSLPGRVAAKLLELAGPAGEGLARTRRFTQVELATMVGAHTRGTHMGPLWGEVDIRVRTSTGL